MIVRCYVAVFIATVIGSIGSVIASTFVVNTIADSGAGSFRDAINQSNNSSGADTVLFAISGAGIHVIRPESILPVISDTVFINGYSQPGSFPATETEQAVIQIVLDGINLDTGYGLEITADQCEVRGLVVGRFPVYGISISNSTGCVFAGNYVGIDASGWLSMANGMTGIRIVGTSSFCTIGGSTPADRNISSTNGHIGIVISDDSFNNRVIGNYVGTDASGMLPMGNGHDGILMSGHSHMNTVGGTSPGERNVVCDNTGAGVAMATYAHENVVIGNYLGVDASGMNALGNHKMGAGLVHNCENNTIGGSVEGSGNLCSGNDWSGIHIEDSVSNTVVLGNVTGLAADGVSPIPNLQHGINLIGGTWGNTIGGEGEFEGNKVFHNTLDGISITANQGNEITGNSICNNQGIGIDLGPNGVTPNDDGDWDSGSNGLQNYPILVCVTSGIQGPVVKGRLNSQPSIEYRLQIYANNDVDPSLHGEGEIYIMSEMVTTDETGHASFLINLPSFIQDGYWISTTATDPAGNTSELSESRFYLAVRAADVDDQIVLDWNEVPGAEEYWVYGSLNTPYFVPYTSSGYENRIAVVNASETTWSSSQGIGDPDSDWSYIIFAVDTQERILARSNRCGEIEYQLSR